MSNFLQDQGNQEITRPAPGREQVIPQIDAEIVEKGHFWMETSVVYQKFLETDVSSASRLRGVFSENRKILPHSIERQLGPGTLPSTAPEDGRLREGSLLCLHHAPDHGLGGVRRSTSS
jgi:hypothetical protein